MIPNRKASWTRIFVAAALCAPGAPPTWAEDAVQNAPSAVSATPAGAPEQAAPSSAASAPVPAPPMTPDQLDTLVAPIALYPDSLLSQMMVASTYPLEIVQATQWLQQHADLKGEDLTKAAGEQGWDPSIQALVVFPDVLKRLSQDITWTTNLGNAFLANQASVMDAVQRMRAKAQDAGKLNSTPQETVQTKTDNGERVIEIVPANPEVIYVPEYDPVWIWGPARFYFYAAWDYPPPPPPGVFFIWGPGFWISRCFIGWNSWVRWGWRPYWGHRAIVINDAFIQHYTYVAPASVVNVTVNRTLVVNNHAVTVWAHNPYHRMGVAYPTPAVRAIYHPVPRPYVSPAVAVARGVPAPMSVHPTVTARQVQTQLRQAQMRAPTTPPPDRIGNRQIPHTAYNHAHSAFSAVDTSAKVRAYRQRGYSSLGRGNEPDNRTSTGGWNGRGSDNGRIR